MVGEAKSHLESNPIPARDAWRTQTNLVHTKTQRPLRDWARTVFECLLCRYGSAVPYCRGRGSGYSRPGYGISPNPTIETYTGLGNRLLEDTNKTLYTWVPRRKQQWPHKTLTQTCPWVSRSLWQRHGLVMACCSIRGTECGNGCTGPFERGGKGQK